MATSIRHKVSFLLLPPRCLVCSGRGQSGRDLCAGCCDDLPWNRQCCQRCGLPMALGTESCGQCLSAPPPFTRTFAPFRYAFPVDRLLPRFKFSGDLACGQLLAELMRQAGADVERPQALIPIPLHLLRLRQRGYDQALELAKALGHSFKIPVLDRALHRQRITGAQSELGVDARHRNVRGAFATAATYLPAHVALVDDVMTTGATVAEAAKTLLRAGAKRVDVWAVARAPSPADKP